MRKLKIVETQAAKGSKYKLLVDRHFGALLQELKRLGYDAEMVGEYLTTDESVDKDLKDRKTHEDLCKYRKKTKEKPIIFITNNYKDFRPFNNPPKTYHIFDIIGTPSTLEKLVNKIQEELRNSKNNFVDSGVTNISFGQVKRYKNQACDDMNTRRRTK